MEESTPREHEVLIDKAQQVGGFLVIPLARRILSKSPYREGYRAADALVLRETNVCGLRGAHYLEFAHLTDTSATGKMLDEAGVSMGFPPHEEALAQIRITLSKLLGDRFVITPPPTREQELAEFKAALSQLGAAERLKKARRSERSPKKPPRLKLIT